MKKLSVQEIKKMDPNDVVDGLNIGFQVAETALPALISIFSKIIEAIGNGPRSRRIKALEQQTRLQEQINKQFHDELELLKSEISQTKI